MATKASKVVVDSKGEVTMKDKAPKKVEKDEKVEKKVFTPIRIKLYGKKMIMVSETETHYLSSDGCTYPKNHPDFN